MSLGSVEVTCTISLPLLGIILPCIMQLLIQKSLNIYKPVLAQYHRYILFVQQLFLTHLFLQDGRALSSHCNYSIISCI